MVRPGKLLAALAATSVAGVGKGSEGAAAHSYTYTAETRGTVRSDFARFREIARSTLRNASGWRIGGHNRFVAVRSGGDFRLILASPAAVDGASPVCSATWSCRVGDQVLINDERWRNTTATWPLSRHQYRHYVINHEVGHWLGLGHVDCPKPGARAPVMMQQSKGLQGCEARVWPVRRGWLRLGRSAYWPVPMLRWYWQWARWYRGTPAYTDRRSPATRPADAPDRIPAWTWEWLKWRLGAGEYAGNRLNPESRPADAPRRIPPWTWEWTRWYLGHRDYTTHRSPVTRPEEAPRRIPDWAWARFSVHTSPTGSS